MLSVLECALHCIALHVESCTGEGLMQRTYGETMHVSACASRWEVGVGEGAWVWVWVCRARGQSIRGGRRSEARGQTTDSGVRRPGNVECRVENENGRGQQSEVAMLSGLGSVGASRAEQGRGFGLRFGRISHTSPAGRDNGSHVRGAGEEVGAVVGWG
jgi:hypothetical protein